MLLSRVEETVTALARLSYYATCAKFRPICLQNKTSSASLIQASDINITLLTMSGLVVDVESELNMPGGVGFIDATDVLKEGTQDMAFGSVLSVEGFELSDAMSALEIMDPRMDTGMTEPPLPFYPNKPLLPAEVCWILDRSFACEIIEMSWHTGLALSQTVYTLQYVHYLGDLGQPHFRVERATQLDDTPYDSEGLERPLKLVTLVLRASVFGLLKCCDLVWRENARDHVVDGEDWNSEKYGVSLCENVQPEGLLSLLDEAVTWLRESPSISSSPWRDPLIHRLLLRKNILEALSSPSSSAIQKAKEHLNVIIAGPSPPEPSATMRGVFDPVIARRLVSFIPTCVFELPLQSSVWESAIEWLDQWYETRQLIGAEKLWSVKVLASLRAYEGRTSRRSTFLRSLSISTFFDGSKILLAHDPPWLIDHFFLETAAIPTGMLSRLAEPLSEDDGESSSLSSEEWESRQWNSERGPSNAPLDTPEKEVEIFEKGLAKLLVDYFTSFYHNRARQRRKLAASLLDWHLAFDRASDLATSLSTTSPLDFALSRVPLCIRHTRLWVITEVICMGFELELYARHEWTMLYWYLGQVLNAQLSILDEVKASLLREDDNTDDNIRNALTYVSVQRDYVCALQCFAFAIRDLLYRASPSRVQIDSIREQANFRKRFKWAFVAGYSEAKILDEDRPVLDKWHRWRRQQELHEPEMNQSVENLLHARDAFLRLSRCKPADTVAVYGKEVYTEFMLGLARACDANLSVIRSSSDIESSKAPVWTWGFSRWFPQIEKSPVT